MLNYVYGKDGWACIRHDGEAAGVPLHEWAKAQCLARGCDDFPYETPEEIDEAVTECCMMGNWDGGTICPVALAYCFASQAVHLRDRLKMYEDTGLTPEEIKQLVEDLELRLVNWVEKRYGICGGRFLAVMNAEKDGRLVVPKCKAGDRVYQTDGIRIYESKVKRILFDTDNIAFDERAIGTSVFQTREEAEAALKEQKGGDSNA